jgi:hypothetical protein
LSVASCDGLDDVRSQRASRRPGDRGRRQDGCSREGRVVEVHHVERCRRRRVSFSEGGQVPLRSISFSTDVWS